MAHGKGGGKKGGGGGGGGGKQDGKHRKETKEERRLRLKSQEEARQACFKALPYAGGILFVMMLVFAMYVRSVPPKLKKQADNATTILNYEEMQNFQADVMKPPPKVEKVAADPEPPGNARESSDEGTIEL